MADYMTVAEVAKLLHFAAGEPGKQAVRRFGRDGTLAELWRRATLEDVAAHLRALNELPEGFDDEQG